MKKTSLCFFTNAYPYGSGETFIENELNFISNRFGKIYLFCRLKTDVKRSLPDNVEIIHLQSHQNISLRSVLKKHLFYLLYLVLHELIFSRQRIMFLEKFRYNISYFLSCIYYSDKIKEKITDSNINSSYFYSYWFFDWNLSLSILKNKNFIKHNFCRAHGFDLYENKGKPNYLPLRNFCLRNTDKVFVVSKKGKEYLDELYPTFTNKVVTSYLGTKDFDFGPIPNIDSVMHLVSCSNVIEVKRLHLIVDILKYMNKPVQWTHFGDGHLLESIYNMTKQLPLNVKVEFMGRQTQKQIFNYYKTVPINYFINTSSSEGIPVSIMEAISFGIPIIATNVGGTSEIVSENTGLLIDKDFNPKIISEIISKSEKDKDPIFRKNVRTYWENNYSENKNYSVFMKMISNL